MLKRIVTGILVAGGALLLFSAQAAAAPHAHEGVNPFSAHESSVHAPKLHCPQHSHHLLLLCPHENRAGGTHPVDCEIGRDCGEHPQATETGFSSLPLMERKSGLEWHCFFSDTPLHFQTALFHSFIFYDPLDPPPRFS